MSTAQTVFRSYSIAGGANGEALADDKSSYVRAEKYSQIVRPATKYIFVEEADPTTWKKGSWVMDVKNKTWVDPLAVWHSRNRSTLGYADGHAELHAWVDSSTIEMSQKQLSQSPIPYGQGEDAQFMAGGFPQAPAEAVSP